METTLLNTNTHIFTTSESSTARRTSILNIHTTKIMSTTDYKSSSPDFTTIATTDYKSSSPDFTTIATIDYKSSSPDFTTITTTDYKSNVHYHTTAELLTYRNTSIPHGLITTESTTTESSSSHTTSPSSVCWCPCTHVGLLSFLADFNLSTEDIVLILHDDVNKLKFSLKIKRKLISKYIRTKVSANDHRKSSQYIGLAAGVVICIPLGLCILSDLFNLYVKIRRK